MNAIAIALTTSLLRVLMIPLFVGFALVATGSIDPVLDGIVQMQTAFDNVQAVLDR